MKGLGYSFSDLIGQMLIGKAEDDELLTQEPGMAVEALQARCCNFGVNLLILPHDSNSKQILRGCHSGEGGQEPPFAVEDRDKLSHNTNLSNFFLVKEIGLVKEEGHLEIIYASSHEVSMVNGSRPLKLKPWNSAS